MTLAGSSAPKTVDQPPWSDANHWDQPQYYLTIHAADVNQDGKAELLGRGSGGIDTWVFDAATAQWQQLNAGACNWTDANHWNQPQYYLTIQAADIDGDGKAELLGRGSGGIETWSFDPAAGQWQQLSAGTCNWTDANGWNAPQYYTTIRAADIDGDGQAELLGRGANGVDTWRFDVATEQWQPVSIGSCGWTDASHWNLPQYYGAIVVADIDGDGCAELMGRGAQGIDTWKFSVADQQWQQLNAGACNWTDANGWNQPQYYSTIQAADIDGDGRAELVGRGANGIDTWRFDVSTQQWQPVSIGTCNWTDANKWNQVQYYSTIQSADLNGDGQAELLGRGSGGIDVWRFDVASGEWVALAVETGEWTDANWKKPQYYRTIHCADVNGDHRAELLCRASNGMETWSFNGAVAGWQVPGPLLTVDARFMQNYVQGGAVSGGQQLVAVTNGDGEAEAFSIGTDGQVYEIYPDSTSDTGWSQAPVGVSATAIAVGLNAPQGALVLVAGQPGGAQYVVQNAAGSATRWGSPISLDVTGPVTQLVARDNGGGQLLVGVVAQTSSTAAQAWWMQWIDGQMTAGSPCAVTGPANAAICAVIDRSYNAGKPGNWQNDFLLMWGTQVVLELGHLGATSDRSGAASPTGKASATRPAVVDVATTIDAHEQSVYYAVLADGNLYSQTVPLYGKNGQLAWKNQLTSQGGSQNVALAGVTAWADASGGQHLLVTDQSGRVYDYDASNSGAPLVDLGVTAAQLAGCPDASGVQQLFVVGPGTGTLSTMWSDADTGDWAVAPVELQSIGGMQSVISYTTEITVRDTIGQPLADAAVTIWSDDLVPLTVNGAAVWVDADQPYATTTNAAGQVTVMAAAGSLDTPLLKVATGAMAAGAAVVIEPNLDVQGRLRTVTDQQLLNPTDIFGDPLAEPLLSGDFATEQNAQQIAQIVTQSMTLVAPTTGTSSTPDRAMVRAIARDDPRFSRRIDLAAVPDQHWRVDCSSGAPVFTTLTPDAAQALLAEKQAGLDAGSFLGIDWGDVWDAVTDAVGDVVSATTELLDLVVTTVANGVQVAITCIIDGLTYVYKGIISLVEQAFDIVAGIFAAIGTAFDTLFEWLGFLFDWPDIVRTQQVVTFVYGQAMALLPTAMTRIQTMVNDQILQYESQLQSFISSLVQGRLGSQDLAAIQASAPVAPAGLEFSSANNVVNTAYLNNVGAAPVPSSATLTADVAGPFDTLIAQLEQYAQQFEVGDNFSQAVDYFTTMAGQLTTQPDQALQSLLAGLLEVVGGLAQVGMETARLVVNVVLGSISEIIAAATGPGGVLAFDWAIPFVSDLYQYVTGTDDPLTPIDLMALVIAVPATVFAKVTTGAAPFPDDDSVAAFQQQFTAQAPLGLMPGTTGADPTAAATPSSAADAGWPDFSPTGLEFLYMINLLSDMAYGFSSAGADIQKVNPVPVEATGVEFGMSIACIVAESLIFFSGCPGWALTAPTNKAWIVWGVGATGLGTDTMMLIATKKVTQLNQDVGVVVSLIEGIEIVALYAIWEGTEGCPWETMLAGMLSATPLLFKPLRLLVVDQLNVLGVPVAPAKRIGLAAIDGIGLVLSGLFGFLGAVNALDQAPST